MDEKSSEQGKEAKREVPGAVNRTLFLSSVAMAVIYGVLLPVSCFLVPPSAIRAASLLSRVVFFFNSWWAFMPSIILTALVACVGIYSRVPERS